MRIGASVTAKAWASVFMAMNSTPGISSLTMRVIALQPPPPKPMTLILAGFATKLDFAISPSLLH
jgi:hypothetical protein